MQQCIPFFCVINTIMHILKKLLIALALIGLLSVPVYSQTSTTGTIRTQSYLLQNEFADGLPVGRNMDQNVRDLITSLVGGTIVGIEIPFFMYGVPAASANLPYLFSRPAIIVATPGIVCNGATGATASTTVTLNKFSGGTSTQVGSVVFAASGSANQTCTSTFSSQVSFAAGDMLIATFPASPDATLANINITIPALQ